MLFLLHAIYSHNGIMALDAMASCPKPLFQSEAKCGALDMKKILCSRANKTHFQKKGFTLILACFSSKKQIHILL